jgi:hypothetical protein
LQFCTLNDGKEAVCVGMALELAVWKEKSLKPPPAARLSSCCEATSSAACFQSNLCAGMAPVVGEARMLEEELSRTGESSSSAGLSPAGMAKYEDGEMGGGEMGRLGGCADLNLGTPPLAPRWNSPLGDRSWSAPSMSPEPESNSVKEVMKGGGVNVKPPCSKLPVEDAMASSRAAEQRRSRRDETRRGA